MPHSANASPGPSPNEICFVSASPADLTGVQEDILQRLVAIHGNATVHAEANGIHAYLASPAALHNDGVVELRKRHLAVNLTKCAQYPAKSNALCMKTRTPYTLADLLSFLPLEQRGLDHLRCEGPAKVRHHDANHYEEIRPGVYVPHNPGELVDLTDLPPDHPAIDYLVRRRFDPKKLQQQFACAWCTAQNPMLYEKPGPQGMVETTRGRLIFRIVDEKGDVVGWQARYLDRVTGDGTVEYLHPYFEAYVPVARMVHGKREPLPGYETLNWAKYKTAPGTHRNQVLLGYRAALDWARDRRNAYFILSEGPLDSGRAGIPGCAVMGKFVSRQQLTLALHIGARGYYLTQNDEAASKASEQLLRLATSLTVPLQIIKPPKGVKDFGDLSPTAARVWLKHTANLTI